jgi:hypothetical protein
LDSTVITVAFPPHPCAKPLATFSSSPLQDRGKTLFGEFLGKCGGKNGGIAMLFVISWWVLI